MRQAKLGLISVVGVASILARSLPAFADLADLDKGHRILLERGFQVHAMAVDQPQIPNWTVFDAGGWNGVDFQFNFFGPTNYLGPAPGHHVWQATYSDYSHTAFSQWEAPYASNCVRIQLDDEQDLNNLTVRANTANWFAAARPNYPDTILSINQIPFAATDANFRGFMTTSQPDMLMIDSYRWTSDPSQGSWNLLSDWQRHRKFALSGNDGSGAHPIPYGFYAQAIDDYGRVPSESELRFEHFAAWAMGYTLTDDFTYNTAAAYSGVESIYFANGSQQANPTASYYQVQSINAEGKRLGPALVRLLSTDVRFINGYNSSGSQNPNPIDIPNWNQGAGDGYLRTYSRVNIGTKNNGYAGDVLLSWFKPLDESLDSTLYSNERYFAVTNGLTDPNGSAADCRQLIALGYDFGTTGIKSLQRLRRDTGTVEVVPLTLDQNGQYVLNVTLDGGTTDLFKFNDGSPFVGIPEAGLLNWDSDNTATGNDTMTGAGLGGSGTWNTSSSQWYRNGINSDSATATNGPHSAVGNAVFWGTSGTVTLATPTTTNALTFKTSGYNITGSTLMLTSSFVTVDSGVSAAISSNLTGSVGLTKTGTGTLSLAGANSYTGGTIVNAGVLGIATSSFAAEPVTPATDININNGSTLRFDANGIALSANRNISLGTGGGVFDTNGNSAAIAGVISGTALTKTGAGPLTLSGTNTYTGGTVVSGGALAISSDANLGAAPASFTAGNITLDGGTLQFGANFDLSNNRGINLGAGGGTIDTEGFTNPSGYTQPDGIRGNGNLTKVGSGTFFINPTPSNQLNHNWKGNLVIKEGTWKITERGGLPYNTNDDSVYRPGQVTFDGGTLQIASTISVSSLQRGITIAAGGGTFDTQGFNFTWGGPVIGSVATAAWNKVGSGQLQLNNSGSVAEGNFPGVFNINGGSVVLNNGHAMGDLAAVNLTNAAGVGLTISGSTETIGSLSGGGANGGNLTLSASVVTGGNNSTTTFSGLVSGSGGLTKTGSGTFTLARPTGNNYSGNTTINAGTLLVNNSTGSGTGTGAVVVQAGATIGGTGKVTGAVTINNGGHIAPGASFESLDVGSLSLGAGSILDFELDTILGVDTSDLIHVTTVGGLAIGGGTLNLTNPGNMTGGIYTLIDYAGSFTGSVSNITLGSVPVGFTYRLFNDASSPSIDLEVTAPGDFNHDGTVDGADYVVFRKGLGITYSPTDYDTWRTHFGQSYTPGAGAIVNVAVPEPATLVLLMFAAAGRSLRRGRAHRNSRELVNA